MKVPGQNYDQFNCVQMLNGEWLGGKGGGRVTKHKGKVTMSTAAQHITLHHSQPYSNTAETPGLSISLAESITDQFIILLILHLKKIRLYEMLLDILDLYVEINKHIIHPPATILILPIQMIHFHFLHQTRPRWSWQQQQRQR